MFIFVKYRNMSIAAGLLTLLLGGCVTTETTTLQSVAANESEAPTETATDTIPPVPDIIDLFIQHPHTVFQLTTQSYSMYVGGELTARFDAQKELFNIVADDNKTTCQYTQAGVLEPLSGEATKKEIKNHTKTCENLVNALYFALS